MTFLIHFYYGNRLEVFKAGLGIIIRALGHSMKVRIYSINDSFSWIDELKRRSDLPFRIIPKTESKNLLKEIKEELQVLDNDICLLANFDLLFDEFLKIEEFVSFIRDINKKNEVIITCEKRYDILEDLGDYVSSFELKNV
jgi:ATP:corrinoid adenosyltransferase